MSAESPQTIAGAHLGTMYEGVPVSTFVVDTIVQFDLFTEIDGAALLYRAGGDAFTRELRRSLRETGLAQLMVRRADLDRYYQYLAGNMKALLSGFDGDAPNLGGFHDVSVMAVGQVIDRPESKPAFDLVSEVIDNAIDLTTRPGGVLACIQAGTTGLKALRAHSMRVCFYGLQLARGLGIDHAGQLADLGVGLMLHDLGKIGPSGSEITADPKLADHPLLGLGRIQSVDHIGLVARDVIEHHHERLDGNGRYHLPADKISTFARIAAVANEFDRRTVDGDGQAILNSFDALRSMISDDPGAYDPKLLALFVRSLSL